MSNEFEESYSEPSPSEPQPRRSRSSRSKPRSIQLPWVIAGAAVVVAAAVAVYFGAIRNSSPAKSAKGGGAKTVQGHYRLVYPKDWETVAPNSVAPGQNAFAAVRQTKGVGVVVFRAGGKIANLTTTYLHGLEAQLKRRSKDFKLVKARMITLKAGKALDVTYELTKHHQVRNVVVLPFPTGSVVMASIATIGDKKTTTEIDDIVSSFQLTS